MTRIQQNTNPKATCTVIVFHLPFFLKWVVGSWVKFFQILFSEELAFFEFSRNQVFGSHIHWTKNGGET